MALFKRSNPTTDDDMVDFDDAAYAWWANREQLEQTFVPKHRDVPRPGTSHHDPHGGTRPSEFEERYSTESLFNWASNPEPDDPTHGGAGSPLDPYRVLGLQPGATLAEVVGAHRALAKKFHPDRFFSEDEAERDRAAQQMSVVNAAYQELRSRLMAHQHRI